MLNSNDITAINNYFEFAVNSCYCDNIRDDFRLLIACDRGKEDYLTEEDNLVENFVDKYNEQEYQRGDSRMDQLFYRNILGVLLRHYFDKQLSEILQTPLQYINLDGMIINVDPEDWLTPISTYGEVEAKCTKTIEMYSTTDREELLPAFVEIANFAIKRLEKHSNALTRILMTRELLNKLAKDLLEAHLSD